GGKPSPLLDFSSIVDRDMGDPKGFPPPAANLTYGPPAHRRGGTRHGRRCCAMNGHAKPARVALVTGGGTGIGRAITLRLAQKDIAVAVNYSRSQDEAEATVREVEAAGGQAFAIRADVSDDDDV